MTDFKGLDDLVQKISSAMPDSIKHVQNDLEKNLQSGLEQTFRKMNLVTREEFDTQTAVLLKTREKIEALEKKVEALEQQLNKTETN